MKSHRCVTGIPLFLLILLAAFPEAGASPPESRALAEDDRKAAQAILQASDQARGAVTGIEWSIALDSHENGRSTHRELTLTAKNSSSLAEFRSPAKVRGQKLLMLDRSMWFIKPGLQKPVPISARQKLMGGASYGDIASTNYAGDYTIESHGMEKVDSDDCHVLDLVARDGRVTYDRIRYWISGQSLCGVKAIFFTVSGTPLKTAQFEYDNRITVDGKSRPFVSRMVIRDCVIKTNVTTLTYSDITLKSVPDSAFNLNLLVR